MRFLPQLPSGSFIAKSDNYFVVMYKVLTFLWEALEAISQGEKCHRAIISSSFSLVLGTIYTAVGRGYVFLCCHNIKGGCLKSTAVGMRPFIHNSTMQMLMHGS